MICSAGMVISYPSDATIATDAWASSPPTSRHSASIDTPLSREGGVIFPVELLIPPYPSVVGMARRASRLSFRLSGPRTTSRADPAAAWRTSRQMAPDAGHPEPVSERETAADAAATDRMLRPA